MDMICPTCGNPTTHHHEGKPSPCSGCQTSMGQLNADLQADRKIRFSRSGKNKNEQLARGLSRLFDRRKRYVNPSDIDRKPEP